MFKGLSSIRMRTCSSILVLTKENNTGVILLLVDCVILDTVFMIFATLNCKLVECLGTNALNFINSRGFDTHPWCAMLS